MSENKNNPIGWRTTKTSFLGGEQPSEQSSNNPTEKSSSADTPTENTEHTDFALSRGVTLNHENIPSEQIKETNIQEVNIQETNTENVLAETPKTLKLKVVKTKPKDELKSNSNPKKKAISKVVSKVKKKISLKSYYSPTPVFWRVIGDSLLFVGTTITGSLIVQESYKLSIISLIATCIGKVITNFATIKDETTENESE